MSVLDDTFIIHQPMDAADYVYELLQLKGPEFGLTNVEYDSRLIREYPAAVIVPGRKDKAYHSSQFFLVHLEVLISVYHAKLNNTHRERSRDDLELCRNIEETLEVGQLDFGGRVNGMGAFVSEIVPGLITRTKGEQVVGSRMTVMIQSREVMSKGV